MKRLQLVKKKAAQKKLKKWSEVETGQGVENKKSVCVISDGDNVYV